MRRTFQKSISTQNVKVKTRELPLNIFFFYNINPVHYLFAKTLRTCAGIILQIMQSNVTKTHKFTYGI